MSFKIRSLTVENFVVFANRQTIDFSTTINNIEGAQKINIAQSNGAGKSLIIDAISLALFGKGVRANYITDYVSSSNPTGGIYIGLELSDGTTILKIERWRRPNSDSNKAKLWKNGVCVSQDSTVSKIDELIQSYIGVNHSNFISCIFSVMVPGFLKLRPAQRFEILEQALAVKRIESVIKKINAAIKLDEEKLNNTNLSAIEANNKYIAENTKKEIYTCNTESITEGINKLTAELSSLLKEEEEKLHLASEHKALHTKLTTKLTPLQQEQETIAADIRSLDSSRELLISKTKSIMRAFKRNGTGTLECAICKSSLTDASKESVSAHYASELSLLENSLKDKRTAHSNISDKVEKLVSARTKLESPINTVNKQLNFIQTNILAVEKALKSSNTALSNSTSSYSDDLLSSLAKEMSDLKIVKAMLEKNIKINIAWKQAMAKNGLRLAYIKEEVATLSALASRYASAVYEKPMLVKFFINDDKDNPTVDFLVNGKNAGLFSTGEGRRLEIAMTLSLMSLLKSSGMSLGFLVLDEALDGLSASSKQAVLKVIDSLSEEYQILMISHDALIQQRPGYVIKITKDTTTELSTVVTHTRI